MPEQSYCDKPTKDVTSLQRVELKFTTRQMMSLTEAAAKRECSIAQLCQETIECEVINLRQSQAIDSQNCEMVKASLYGCSLRDFEE